MSRLRFNGNKIPDIQTREEPFISVVVDGKEMFLLDGFPIGASRAKWLRQHHDAERRRVEAPYWHHLQGILSRAMTRKIPDSGIREMFGYGADELRACMERHFVDGMSWSNYAGALPWRSPLLKWHVDHIKPKSRFWIENKKEAFALSNLQPLWERENMQKGRSWRAPDRAEKD